MKTKQFMPNNPPVVNNKNNKTKVAVASVVGSAVGIAGGVAAIYSMAKKGNPALALKKLAYSEKDILLLGTGSVLGGLTAGVIADDKKNAKYKVREASQQIVGNMLVPLAMLEGCTKLLEKSKFQIPQINSKAKVAQIVNKISKPLPKVLVTAGALVCGMEIGNKLMGAINNKIYKEEVKHEVAPEDYLVHSDDVCLTANMLLKDVPAATSVTSAILPATMLVSGIKTGMQQQESV